MRILNFILNAEIKYQEHINSENYKHEDFQSNNDPGKTHKGKTSERGILLFMGF
jgi:hypothetical protein